MIAIDTNLLVYAFRQDSEFHARAQDCLGRLAQGREAWAIPWPCAREFLSVMTHKRIFKTAAPMALAVDAVDAWMESPSMTLLCESGRHWSSLRDALTTGQIVGPKVHDARIAALCLQHGVRELWTADRDFGRFPALKTVNPLVAR